MLSRMLILVALRTQLRCERLVVLAGSDAEALAKCRAARPGMSPGAFRVVLRESADVMPLPRGRPPSAARVAAAGTWLPFAGEADAATIT